MKIEAKINKVGITYVCEVSMSGSRRTQKEPFGIGVFKRNKKDALDWINRALAAALNDNLK